MSGAPITTTPTPIINALHRMRKERIVNGDGTITEYMGYASPNTEESDAGWLIIRNSYDATGEFIAADLASKSEAFIHVWTSRASYTYA